PSPWKVIRDPVVDHVDDSTDCARTIEKRGRTANALDAVRPHHLRRHGVIGARARSIPDADAVLQHPYPIAAEPSNDRAARPRPEGRCRDTRLARERVADGPRCL